MDHVLDNSDFVQFTGSRGPSGLWNDFRGNCKVR